MFVKTSNTNLHKNSAQFSQHMNVILTIRTKTDATLFTQSTAWGVTIQLILMNTFL